jgi:alpha-ketoglutarate-dependent taurine dioxygenase
MTTLMGRFVERAADRHVGQRETILRRRRWYPEPNGVYRIQARANGPFGLLPVVREQLTAYGAALLAFDRVLSNRELVRFAEAFGTPLPQPNPRTQPWVDDRVILNLRADFAETADHTWGLLFAENYVMLHTELAARPAEVQPRYVLLQCVEPSPRDMGGQTVLVDMDRVRHSLTDRQAAILKATCRSGDGAGPPFLRHSGDREIFSFKDEAEEGIPWNYERDGQPVVRQEVNDAIRRLLSALYDAANVTGFYWQPGTLGIIDNHRLFHGRTFAPRACADRPRHLRRVRVLCDPR